MKKPYLYSLTAGILSLTSLGYASSALAYTVKITNSTVCTLAYTSGGAKTNLAPGGTAVVMVNNQQQLAVYENVVNVQTNQCTTNAGGATTSTVYGFDSGKKAYYERADQGSTVSWAKAPIVTKATLDGIQHIIGPGQYAIQEPAVGSIDLTITGGGTISQWP